MMIKKGFVLREVADSFVVMKIGGELSFNGMITLNESGAVIWKGLEDGLDENAIAKSLTEEYEIGFEAALADVKRIVLKLSEAGIIE